MRKRAESPLLLSHRGEALTREKKEIHVAYITNKPRLWFITLGYAVISIENACENYSEYDHQSPESYKY